MGDVTNYTKCSLCGDFAVGGIEVDVITPAGRQAQRRLCPECTEAVQQTAAALATD